MVISKNQLVLLVQKELNRMYGTNLVLDGIIGSKTMTVLGRVKAIPSTWPIKRRFVGFIQYLTHIISEIEDIAVDGYFGADTHNAYNEIMEFRKSGNIIKWRDSFDEPNSSFEWPRYKDLRSFFGEPGENLTDVRVPYALTIAWNTSRSINKFTCHKLVVEPIQMAMEEIYEIYGKDGIEELNLNNWGGCYSHRKMRGGSNLSTHSWGISQDFIPLKNQLRWKSDRASLAKPEYDSFWKAWENVGAISMGRTRNFDWMHKQFCRL